jgi:hypothetical protein
LSLLRRMSFRRASRVRSMGWCPPIDTALDVAGGAETVDVEAVGGGLGTASSGVGAGLRGLRDEALPRSPDARAAGAVDVAEEKRHSYERLRRD